MPDRIDVTSVAGEVALSPDYLGRLCKQQTGVSFSATIRWERLVTAVSHLLDGYSVTEPPTWPGSPTDRTRTRCAGR